MTRFKRTMFHILLGASVGAGAGFAVAGIIFAFNDVASPGLLVFIMGFLGGVSALVGGLVSNSKETYTAEDLRQYANWSLWFGIVAVGSAIYLEGRERGSDSVYPAVARGTITGGKITTYTTRGTGTRSYSSSFDYVFTVGGKQFSGQGTSGSPRREDEKIHVRYDPRDPSRNRAYADRSPDDGFRPGLVIAVGLLASVGPFYFARRLRRLANRIA